MLPKNRQSIMMFIVVVICLVFGFVAGYMIRGLGEADPSVERSICVFGEDQNVSGYIRIAKQLDGRTFIHGNLTGLEGPKGMHIHEFGNIGDKCRAAGGHFNPFHNNHGSLDSGDRHIGDLGNILFKDRAAEVSMETPVDLLNGETSVIGRAIVIHHGSDDLGLGNHPSSSVNGRSGPRMACCVIAIERS